MVPVAVSNNRLNIQILLHVCSVVLSLPLRSLPFRGWATCLSSTHRLTEPEQSLFESTVLFLNLVSDWIHQVHVVLHVVDLLLVLSFGQCILWVQPVWGYWSCVWKRCWFWVNRDFIFLIVSFWQSFGSVSQLDLWQASRLLIGSMIIQRSANHLPLYSPAEVNVWIIETVVLFIVSHFL